MRRLLLLLPLAVIAAGCASNPVVGKWTGTQMGAELTYNMTGDNKFTMDASLGQAGMNVMIKAAGAYKIDKDQLTMTTETVTIDDSKIPAAQKAMIKQMLNPDSLKQQMNASGSGTFKVEGETLTVTSGANTLSLTKAK